MAAEQQDTAPDGQSNDELRAELRTVEEELEELRRTLVDLRTRTGSRAEGPMDPEDQAAALTAADEQDALIAALEGRRDRLRRRLGMAQP